MSKEKHGKRYKPSHKQEILDFLEKHTYKETFEKYKVSEPTIARWKKSANMQENVKTLSLTLPEFWREYLDELVQEKTLGANIQEVVVSLLRENARRHIAKKKSDDAVTEYLGKVNSLITQSMLQNSEIEAFLVIYRNQIFLKTEKWGETDALFPLLRFWTALK